MDVGGLLKKNSCNTLRKKNSATFELPKALKRNSTRLCAASLALGKVEIRSFYDRRDPTGHSFNNVVLVNTAAGHSRSCSYPFCDWKHILHLHPHFPAQAKNEEFWWVLSASLLHSHDFFHIPRPNYRMIPNMSIHAQATQPSVSAAAGGAPVLQSQLQHRDMEE